jgi:hypothetical protein
VQDKDSVQLQITDPDPPYVPGPTANRLFASKAAYKYQRVEVVLCKHPCEIHVAEQLLTLHSPRAEQTTP